MTRSSLTLALAAAAVLVAGCSEDHDANLAEWWPTLTTEQQTGLCDGLEALDGNGNALLSAAQSDADTVNLGPAGYFDDTAEFREGFVPALETMLTEQCPALADVDVVEDAPSDEDEG